MTTAIDPPTLVLTVDKLVDWLELTAIFNTFGIARIDELTGALYQLEETAEDDIGQRDREREERVEQLENEVELRQRALGGAYPFTLDDTGEELHRVEDWQQEAYAFYLICLVSTHLTNSPILSLPPSGELLTRLRNRIFQIVCTLGLAGVSRGPALSIGWPRRSGETIVELLTRAEGLGAGFTVRNPIGKYVSPQAKDGGIDVIAWTPDALPPPIAFYFAQAASGANWPEKPVTVHAEVFSQAYIQDHMTGNKTYITLIPFRVLDDAFWNSQHQFHRAILDRLRLPARALEGLQLARRGVPIDHAHDVNEINVWLKDYVNYAQGS